MGATPAAGASAGSPAPGSARRQALREARRALIVAAARRVFTRVGLEAATLRAIAAEAGCTTGALYPVFAGKEEIYAAVLADSLHALRRRVEAAAGAAGVAQPGAGAAAGLLAFYDYYLERPEELALGLYLFNGLKPAGLSAELDRALNEQLRGVFAPLEARLAEAGAPDPVGRTAGGIAQAIGALVLERTGRTRLWGRSGRALLLDYLAFVQ
jgi:AcrR family transcriptional regulator